MDSSQGLLKLAREREIPEQTPTEKEESGIAFSVLLTALKALSQRTLVAFSALFSLISCGSVFWLAYSVREKASWETLTLVLLYGAFVLGLHMVKRRN